MSLALTAFQIGDRVVIGENVDDVPAGRSGSVVRLLDNGNLVVELWPDKRYVVAPEVVAPEQVEPQAIAGAVRTVTSEKTLRSKRRWRIGDKVRLTQDAADGTPSGTTGTIFGSSVRPGYVEFITAGKHKVTVPADGLEADGSSSRLREALKQRRAEEREQADERMDVAEETVIPERPTASEGQDAPVKSLVNIWERQAADETPDVEALAEVPQLLDEPPSETPKKRKSRGPMSPEHKQALMAGKERARAAREQAERERADTDADTPAEDETIVMEVVVVDDPPRTATVNRSSTGQAPTSGWISLPQAADVRWRDAVMKVPPAPAFDLTSSARQLLMDALAAQEPIVRLTPLIAWVRNLEDEARA